MPDICIILRYSISLYYAYTFLRKFRFCLFYYTSHQVKKIQTKFFDKFSAFQLTENLLDKSTTQQFITF